MRTAAGAIPDVLRNPPGAVLEIDGDGRGVAVEILAVFSFQLACKVADIVTRRHHQVPSRSARRGPLSPIDPLKHPGDGGSLIAGVEAMAQVLERPHSDPYPVNRTGC
jgi:hypothetical protein